MARFGRNSPKPNLAVPNGFAQAIVDRVLPGRTLAAVTCLQGGEMGAVYELKLVEDQPSLVLKVYPQEFQWKMQKEVAVIARLDGRLTVPIPRILLADDSKSLLDLNFVVMNKLEGEILLALEDSLTKAEVLSAYTQMGRLLREFHQIGMEAFGYIGPHGLWTPQSTNHAYVTTRFESKLEEFIERGGDPGLARRVTAYLRAHEDLLHACALPVLCHNDFHARNVLARRASGTLRLSGILDVEGAQAAERHYAALPLISASSASVKSSSGKRAFSSGKSAAVKPPAMTFSGSVSNRTTCSPKSPYGFISLGSLSSSPWISRTIAMTAMEKTIRSSVKPQFLIRLQKCRHISSLILCASSTLRTCPSFGGSIVFLQVVSLGARAIMPASRARARILRGRLVGTAGEVHALFVLQCADGASPSLRAA